MPAPRPTRADFQKPPAEAELDEAIETGEFTGDIANEVASEAAAEEVDSDTGEVTKAKPETKSPAAGAPAERSQATETAPASEGTAEGRQETAAPDLPPRREEFFAADSYAIAPPNSGKGGKPNWMAWDNWMRQTIAVCRTEAEATKLEDDNERNLQAFSLVNARGRDLLRQEFIRRRDEIAAMLGQGE
jgi:hypothetical protein